MRSRLNGAPWYDATRHVLTISGATDASSQARGGLIRGPFGAFSAFKAVTDFPAARHNAHINIKETFALHEVPKLVTTTRPGGLKGSTAVVDVDHKRCTMPLERAFTEHADPRPYCKTLLAASKRRLHPGAPLGMLRGELGGRQFDQTRTHGTRQAIPGGVR